MNNIVSVILSMLNNNKKKKEKYVGSNRNRTTKEKKWSMSRNELFLSDWNTKKLTAAIYHSYKDLVNGPFDREYFRINVPRWMQNWVLVNNLDEFEDHKYNFVDTFVKINRTFIRDTIDNLRHGINMASVHDIKSTYGDGNFDEITPQDADDYFDPIPYFKSGLYETPSYTESVLANETANISMNRNEFPNLGEVVMDELKREAAESTPKRDYFDVEDYRQLDA